MEDFYLFMSQLITLYLLKKHLIVYSFVSISVLFKICLLNALFIYLNIYSRIYVSIY